jgi:hypothetical protein
MFSTPAQFNLKFLGGGTPINKANALNSAMKPTSKL